MPATSKAQLRWAYWAEKHPQEAGVSAKVAREFEHTGGKELPERKGKPKGKASHEPGHYSRHLRK